MFYCRMLIGNIVMENILKRLENKKKSGDGYTARCPAHKDKHNSLSISKKDDRILLHCHAGCSTEIVVAKLGLMMSDLFLNGNGKAKKNDIVFDKPNIKSFKDIPEKQYGGFTLSKKYEYHDETGTLQYVVVRYQKGIEKKFLPFTPIEDGWISKCDSKILYRLPQLVSTKDEEATIFICEGEKDVDTMIDRGLIATTNPFGASTWKDSFNAYFTNRNIVLLPDNDIAGYKHMESIAKQLSGIAKSIKIVKLPVEQTKEDVTDFFTKYNGTAEQLNILTAETEEYKTSSIENSINDLNLPFCFWFEHRNSKKSEPELKIDIDALIEFLIKEGIRIMTLDSDGLTRILIQINDNVVSRIDEGLIRNKITNKYLKMLPENISDNFTRNDLRRILRRGINNYIEKNKLDSLPIENVQWIEDTPTSSFYFFSNGFVEVSKDGITLKPYSEMKGCIWKSQIINHKFEIVESSKLNDFSFVKFTRNICTPFNTPKKVDESRYFALKCTIGYLLHRYIDVSAIFSVIFTENNLNDEPEGRTGKTLLVKQAVGKLRNVTLIDGRSTNFQTNEFAFQQCDMDTQIILIDDCKSNLDFEWFFSKITGETEINKKKKQSFIIHSKYCFTTNYGIKGYSGSNLARRFDMELFPYYSKEFSPRDEFGESFFSGWDNNQWKLFYNYMLNCVSEYFKNGCSIPSYKSETISERKLISETNADFIAFADLLPRNQFISSVETYNNYIEFSNENPKLFSKNILGKWIKSYCKSRNIEYTSIVVKENGKPVRKHYLKEEDKIDY